MSATWVDTGAVNVLKRFPDAKPSGNGWVARCPAHDDRHASLSIGVGAEGRWLVKCHARCSLDAILAATGLTMRDLFANPTRPTKTIIATYSYQDEQGQLLYEVVRYAPKQFRQRRPNGCGGWLWRLGTV